MPIGATILENAGTRTYGNKFSQHDEVTHDKFANYVKNKFEVQATDGDSDHYITMISKVSHEAKVYDTEHANNPATAVERVAPDFMNRSGSALRSWLSAAAASIIFACENSDIKISNVTFETPDPATPGKFNEVPGLAFLKLWRSKFNDAGGNSNDGSADLGAGNHEPNCDPHAFNFVEMGAGFHNKVGAYHDKLFVIPLKEYKLSGRGNNYPEWKKLYFKLIGDDLRDAPEVYTEFADRFEQLNVKQKIILNLTANSIPVTAPKPMLLLQALLRHFAKLPEGIGIPADIPVHHKIGSLSFFDCTTVLDLDRMLSDVLYLGRNTEGGVSSFYSTYPFDKSAIDAIKGGTEFQNVKLDVRTSSNDSSEVHSAKVSFSFTTKLNFVGVPGDDGITPTGEVTFAYPVSRTYDADHIQWIRGLPTLCMFPNFTTDTETFCNKFYYFSRSDANVLLSSIKGLGQAINLMEASLVGVLNNGDAPVKLVDPTAPANHAAVRYTTKIYGTDVQVSTTEASVPEHFIEVKDNFMNQSYGYVMNLRGADGDIPALLKDGYTVGSIGIVAPGDVALQGTLKACVDFGSSSSIVRCNIDGGADIPTPIENSCTLRKCLTEYNFNKYKSVINDPENENHKFLSNVSVYDAVNGVGIPVTPYKKAWTPLVKSYRHYPEIGNINSSHKTELTLAGVDAPYPRMIIQTMCYNIACTAINRHCNKVVIVPSLPSEQYKTGLNTAWDSAIAQMHIMFPQLTMEHTLTYNNIHYLYESIAVSLGAGTTGGNNLTISVDIGDGTTDMSAIFYDVGGNVNLCGCSSIEYAGKDLIKTVLKDIVANTTGDIAKKMFEGNLGASAAYGPSVFKPNAGEEDNYLHFVEDIIAAGVGSDNFERLVMDILDISTLNAGVGNNDQKVAANFILRYMILMPVVKDFIHVAIKLAQKLPTPYDP
ncbi:MAG: hypothetical protein IJL94_03485, partial [Erysipelotrichaceae bacterium]|nr:hypothetical protein [Erysipelotrichaceae bacterium]